MSRLLDYIAKKYNLNLILEQKEMDNMEKVDAYTFIRVVCEKLGVRYSDIIGPRRTAEIVHVRQCIMFALTSHGFSLRQAAYAVNRINHTTSLYARDTIQGYIDMGEKKTLETLLIINEALKYTGWEELIISNNKGVTATAN